MTLKEMLADMLKFKASDLHLRVGLRPIIRVDGKLKTIGNAQLVIEEMEQIMNQILTGAQRGRFIKWNEMDLALSVSKLGRFRLNFYRQRGTVGIAIRAVNTSIPTAEELNLPLVVKEIANEKRGLVIVTGTTGSGKSTTLASMIEHINNSRGENIVTIEDPIEYVYRDKNSIISQREVGGDTESFTTALRQAFRQDPDVILIGEVRDLDTMNNALTAADTGHLVLTTLHTLNAVETINRMVSFFPPHQHEHVRLMLAGTLKAIVCQRLIPRSDGPGRIPAAEVLIGTPLVKEYIINSTKTPQIVELIEKGVVQYGMQSFDQSIMKLYKTGLISYEEAISQTSSPDDFELRVKGITGASDQGWSDFERMGQKNPSQGK